MNKQVVIALFLILNLPQKLFSNETVIFDEPHILDFMDQGLPHLDEIEVGLLQARSQYLGLKDALSFQFEGQGEASHSNEKLLNSFDGGVTQEAKYYSLGVMKPTLYGLQLGAKVFSQSVTNAFVTDATTSGLTFNLALDLYKDFLGRTTKSRLEKGDMSTKRAKLEEKARKKVLEGRLRKLYWSLVANKERERLLSGIVDLSEKQYKEAVRRRRSGVADSGEVARYHSLWSSRRSSLLSVSYQKNEILRQLKEVVPSLNGKNVEIGAYNIDHTIQKVLVCTAEINRFKDAPLQFSPYDEIIDYLAQEERLEKKVIETYDDPSLKLTGELSHIGRDFSFSDAYSDTFDQGRARTAIGLQFSVPLGKRKRTTKEVTQMLAHKRYQAQMQIHLSKMKAFHSETSSMIKTLQAVVASQKETNKYLAESMSVSRKKYRQARIGIEELINEQNAQLESQLNEIDTNLTIMFTLLDYFGVYPDFPCQLNRIQS